MVDGSLLAHEHGSKSDPSRLAGKGRLTVTVVPFPGWPARLTSPP